MLKKFQMRNNLHGWLILSLPIVFTLWLKYYPILRAVCISLVNYSPINDTGEFVGWKNYTNIMSENYYWQAWKNTFVFLLLQITMTFFIPIIQAIALSELKKFKNFMSTIYILPVLIPTTINVIIWRWIWHPDYGVANSLIKIFGVEPQKWLSDPNLVKFCIIVPGIIGGGIGVLLYYSAIQNIPKDILESASLDGCIGWRKIFHITIPNIRFIIFIQFVIAVASSIQLLDVPYLFASGGPSGASTTQGIYIYNVFNQEMNYGKGSAASVVLMLVAILLTTIQMKFEKTERL
ncbi:multiple sugar transport system permease [Enterococcus sp. DIV0421]|uniref:carbohydrate ABC transporter permease n=1 Tax=Enterococcus sp. DIV0421 TaxID=2774688 RepID=UPI003F2375DD